MSHLEPEQLALIAMGEPVASDAEADHLAECAECADELALLRHTAIVGRSAIDAGELETPPEVVWSRISEELGLGRTSWSRSVWTKSRMPRRARRGGRGIHPLGRHVSARPRLPRGTPSRAAVRGSPGHSPRRSSWSPASVSAAGR